MALKGQWVNSLDLGGVMVWSIEADDWRGYYGEEYPLVNTLKRIMNRSVANPFDIVYMVAPFISVERLLTLI